MTLITKDNLISFMDYYHYFHDSYITNVKYDFKKNQIEIFIDVYWSGNPIINDDGNIICTNKTKLKITCYDIYQFNYKEIYTDYIDDAYLNYILINKEEYICFATDKVDPLISVVCKNIKYEELKIT